MGTREVYEEKLRSGNLYHDPTINPGLGSPRCPRCLSLLIPNSVRPHTLSLTFVPFVFRVQCLWPVWWFYSYVNFLVFFFCFGLMIQVKGEWTITSVLHDATAVVSFFSSPLGWFSSTVLMFDWEVPFGWILVEWTSCFRVKKYELLNMNRVFKVMRFLFVPVVSLLLNFLNNLSSHNCLCNFLE